MTAYELVVHLNASDDEMARRCATALGEAVRKVKPWAFLPAVRDVTFTELRRTDSAAIKDMRHCKRCARANGRLSGDYLVEHVTAGVQPATLEPLVECTGCRTPRLEAPMPADLFDSLEAEAAVLAVIDRSTSEHAAAIVATIYENVLPGETFSANDIRELLPAGIPTSAIGAVFGGLKKSGRILPCGREISTVRSTRHEITRYVLATLVPDLTQRIEVKPERRGDGVVWCAYWPDPKNPGSRCHPQAGTAHSFDPVLPIISAALGLPIVYLEQQ